VDLLISEDEISKIVAFREMLAEIESARFGSAAPMTATFLSKVWSRTRGDEAAATYWLREIFPSNISEFVKRSCDRAEPNRDTLLGWTQSEDLLKMFLINQVLRAQDLELAQFRVAGTKSAEWSLFIYRPGTEPRVPLAVALGTAPADLSLTTLTGEPLEAGSSGDALLDQALAICAHEDMALSLDPERLAALPGSPWKDATSAQNWKKGVAVAALLADPPTGWSRVEYRLASRRGGRASVAWVPGAAQPSGAIARALGRSETEISITNGASGADSLRKAA
jgi:hypothetical protein